ncbi:MAG: hypothetical protein JWM68_887 [Verrucomicrobiales bacterium]|nr:hypothetical protein [Verrucomicrobiales bacterium]
MGWLTGTPIVLASKLHRVLSIHIVLEAKLGWVNVRPIHFSFQNELATR